MPSKPSELSPPRADPLSKARLQSLLDSPSRITRSQVRRQSTATKDAPMSPLPSARRKRNADVVDDDDSSKASEKADGKKLSPVGRKSIVASETSSPSIHATRSRRSVVVKEDVPSELPTMGRRASIRMQSSESSGQVTRRTRASSRAPEFEEIELPSMRRPRRSSVASPARQTRGRRKLSPVPSLDSSISVSSSDVKEQTSPGKMSVQDSTSDVSPVGRKTPLTPSTLSSRMSSGEKIGIVSPTKGTPISSPIHSPHQASSGNGTGGLNEIPPSSPDSKHIQSSGEDICIHTPVGKRIINEKRTCLSDPPVLRATSQKMTVRKFSISPGLKVFTPNLKGATKPSLKPSTPSFVVSSTEDQTSCTPRRLSSKPNTPSSQNSEPPTLESFYSNKSLESLQSELNQSTDSSQSGQAHQNISSCSESKDVSPQSRETVPNRNKSLSPRKSISKTETSAIFNLEYEEEDDNVITTGSSSQGKRTPVQKLTPNAVFESSSVNTEVSSSVASNRKSPASLSLVGSPRLMAHSGPKTPLSRPTPPKPSRSPRVLKSSSEEDNGECPADEASTVPSSFDCHQTEESESEDEQQQISPSKASAFTNSEKPVESTMIDSCSENESDKVSSPQASMPTLQIDSSSDCEEFVHCNEGKLTPVKLSHSQASVGLSTPGSAAKRTPAHTSESKLSPSSASQRKRTQSSGSDNHSTPQSGTECKSSPYPQIKLTRISLSKDSTPSRSSLGRVSLGSSSETRASPIGSSNVIGSPTKIYQKEAGIVSSSLGKDPFESVAHSDTEKDSAQDSPARRRSSLNQNSISKLTPVQNLVPSQDNNSDSEDEDHSAHEGSADHEDAQDVSKSDDEDFGQNVSKHHSVVEFLNSSASDNAGESLVTCTIGSIKASPKSIASSTVAEQSSNESAVEKMGIAVDGVVEGFSKHSTSSALLGPRHSKSPSQEIISVERSQSGSEDIQIDSSDESEHADQDEIMDDNESECSVLSWSEVNSPKTEKKKKERAERKALKKAAKLKKMNEKLQGSAKETAPSADEGEIVLSDEDEDFLKVTNGYEELLAELHQEYKPLKMTKAQKKALKKARKLELKNQSDVSSAGIHQLSSKKNNLEVDSTEKRSPLKDKEKRRTEVQIMSENHLAPVCSLSEALPKKEKKLKKKLMGTSEDGLASKSEVTIGANDETNTKKSKKRKLLEENLNIAQKKKSTALSDTKLIAENGRPEVEENSIVLNKTTNSIVSEEDVITPELECSLPTTSNDAVAEENSLKTKRKKTKKKKFSSDGALSNSECISSLVDLGRKHVEISPSFKENAPPEVKKKQKNSKHNILTVADGGQDESCNGNNDPADPPKQKKKKKSKKSTSIDGVANDQDVQKIDEVSGTLEVMEKKKKKLKQLAIIAENELSGNSAVEKKKKKKQVAVDEEACNKDDDNNGDLEPKRKKNKRKQWTIVEQASNEKDVSQGVEVEKKKKRQFAIISEQASNVDDGSQDLELVIKKKKKKQMVFDCEDVSNGVANTDDSKPNEMVKSLKKKDKKVNKISEAEDSTVPLEPMKNKKKTKIPSIKEDSTDHGFLRNATNEVSMKSKKTKKTEKLAVSAGKLMSAKPFGDSDSDDAPVALSFSAERKAALAMTHAIAESIKIEKERKKEKLRHKQEQRHQQMLAKAEKLKKKTHEYLPGASGSNVTSESVTKKSSFLAETAVASKKRLPPEVLASLSEQPPLKTSRKLDGSKQVTFSNDELKKQKKKEKKMALKLAKKKTQQEEYIPLQSGGGATRFGVVPLRNIMTSKNKLANEATSFRKEMLFGQRIKRTPISTYLAHEEKLKAASKDKF